ncbi:MAG: MBL fold metallo-hydrolase [Chloroflexota bacterium]|nr:MBL fold metallo-hydrolase [Chloroflexota bacterium]
MLVELGDRVSVLPGGVNIGVLRGDDHRCVLIDAGLNETSAKKALKALRQAGGEVVAILTTHAHADHFGGNAAVVKRTGARVYALAFDEAVLRYPLLQPMTLFAGADPLETLRGNFLLADPSPVDEVVQPGSLLVEGIEVEVVPLPGHSPNQVGYLVDGVFFCADVVLPESVLAKYKIPYLCSVTDHLGALDTAEAVACQVAVPGHGEQVESLAGLVRANRALILEVMERVAFLAQEPVTAEGILTDLLNHYAAAVTDAPSFYLLQPTVYAFLSHLHRQGRLTHEVRHGQSLWVAC